MKGADDTTHPTAELNVMFLMKDRCMIGVDHVTNPSAENVMF